VELRTVTLAFSQGNMSAIQSGLNPGEEVVTDGQDKLQNGSKVDVPGSGAVNAGDQQPGQQPGQPGKKRAQKGAPGQ
jgi:membrane fusion protein, multidrug efflux system